MKTALMKITTIILFFVLFLPQLALNKSIQYNQTSNNFLDTNSIKLISISDAAESLLQLIPGFITKAELIYKNEHPLWRINLTTIQNGIIKFELSAIDKKLIRIDSEEGPFDYEIIPGNFPVKYSTAKKIAEDKTGLKILKWNFSLNKNKWEYNFWMFSKSGKAQLKVSADTGEIITNKKKH